MMGVDRTDYIVYGWKVAYDPAVLQNPKYLPNIEGHKGVELELISDNMNGKYMVWGIVLDRCDEDGWDFWEFDIFNEEVRKTLINEVNKLGLMFDTQPKILLFTRWS